MLQSRCCQKPDPHDGLYPRSDECAGRWYHHQLDVQPRVRPQNFIIRSLGGTALEWSLNPRLATFVIAFASVWASIGFNMILYIGGINSISNDLYEAATIDGASGVRPSPHHCS
ncbi:MAG: carbohydrate ABC transporter permease [Gemmiger formicilis]|uniref:carbohydrate ABC transporter permease n=1 Tax=Gemmiger formicilis TaxID=745368 RepID=UPI0039A0F1BE